MSDRALTTQMFAVSTSDKNASQLLTQVPTCFNCVMKLIALAAEHKPTVGADERIYQVLGRAAELSKSLSLLESKAVAFAALGEVWSYKGDTERALIYYNQALETCAQGRHMEHLVAPILVNVANIQQDSGHLDDALRTLQRVVSIYRADDYRQGLGEAYGNLANVYQDLRQLELACDSRLKSLDAYAAVGDLAQQADGLTNLALIYADMGNIDSAIATCRQAVSLLDSAGDAAQAARSFNNLGVLFKSVGEMTGASLAFTAAEKAARRSGDAALRAAVAANATDLH